LIKTLHVEIELEPVTADRLAGDSAPLPPGGSEATGAAGGGDPRWRSSQG